MKFIFQMLAANNADEAIERACQVIRNGERARIFKFDPKGRNLSRGQQRLLAIANFDNNAMSEESCALFGVNQKGKDMASEIKTSVE